jgi:glutathione-regulated potassium-efflux system ancillary protein KefC
MLATIFFLLAATVVFVSLTRHLGLGSILGYLVSGALIGPAGLRLVSDVDEIAEIAELGVLMLLFLIGLELRPRRLWLLRKTVFGLGPAQLVTTAVLLGAALFLAGQNFNSSLVLGIGFALSSTAIALPMLAERDLLNTTSGRDSFAVLLFQDMATVPLVAAVPLIGHPLRDAGPVWPGLVKAAIAVAVIIIVGRYLLRPFFRLIGGVKTQEVFTAAALLTVVAGAAGAHLAGLPSSLGAFAAGVLLSESEYRHELEADVAPFEGLLLGFFFISVGMAADLSLIVKEPGFILVGALLLMVAKIAVLFLVERLRGARLVTAVRASLAMAQGSEFTFVLFGVAIAAGALSKTQYDRAMLVVALSMAASPILFALSERFLVPRIMPPSTLKPDVLENIRPRPVIILGFGRFGQIVGRILKLRNIPFHAIDDDAENIETVRRFGNVAYFGDPARTELLRAVGVSGARIVVVAVGDVTQSLRIVERVTAEFPHLTIFARARNRHHAHRLTDLGVTHVVRELFFSSLRLTELVLVASGVDESEAQRTVHTFRDHDEKTLIAQQKFYEDEREMIQTAAQAARELQTLFEADAVDSVGERRE